MGTQLNRYQYEKHMPTGSQKFIKYCKMLPADGTYCDRVRSQKMPLERETKHDLVKMQQKTHVQKDKNQRDKYEGQKKKFFDVTTRSQGMLETVYKKEQLNRRSRRKSLIYN